MASPPAPVPARARRFRPRHVLAAIIVASLAASGDVFGGSLAAFNQTTANPGDQVAAGSVALTSNAGGSAMFALSGLKPGDTRTGCVNVTYNGSLPATVRLFGTTTGTALDRYVALTVTRGTFATAPAFPSCTGFAADSATHLAERPAGIVFAGTLEDFADDYASAIVDAPSATETWTSGEQHAYHFRVTIGNNTAARGLSTATSFHWEARNQ